MHIEVTRTTGQLLKINVLSIDTVQSGGKRGFGSMENTSISLGSCTYYVQESYEEVSTKMEEALAKLPSEVVVAKCGNK